MKSVMQHSFGKVPAPHIPRSLFNRSSGYKTTFNVGKLVPVYVDEVLPGDTFRMNMTSFCRLATPIHPILDNLYMDVHFFFVPNRLIWEKWQQFCGEQTYPGDSTDYLVPIIDTPAGGWDVGTLGDYFGLPTGIDSLGDISALPFRAYNLIFNEWYRDENLIANPTSPVDNGPDNPGIYGIQRRCKRHDYFTSALPWPQKGDSVSMPIGDTAPVSLISDGNPMTLKSLDGNDFIPSTEAALYARNTGTLKAGSDPFEEVLLDPTGHYVTDLSAATASTINQFRQAFQVQRMLEKDARGGTRYVELIKSHFGVISPDARLQRPEYLGGGSTRVNISPIPQTSGTGEYAPGSPQGNLAAIGTATMHRCGFNKTFTEHGIVLGLISVRADLTYQQGIDKQWLRQTRYDFYWPSLSHLGEQAVLSKEIYADGTDDDDQVFGYQERYAEYRYRPSKITGQFRSSYSQSLDTWLLSQYFDTRPTLNESFIVEHPPIERVIAVPSEPHVLLDAYFDLKCARPMPVYSVPGLIDHF